jgi:hypothetical protein
VIERLVGTKTSVTGSSAQMERKHVSAIVGGRKGARGAANDILKKLRILLRFAIDNGMRKDDPTLRIKSFAKAPSTHGRMRRFQRSRTIGRSGRESGPPLRCPSTRASGSATSAACHGATSKAQRSR